MTVPSIPEEWLGQRLAVRNGQWSSIVRGLGWSIKDESRADTQAEARSDAAAPRISGREQEQVLAKCGSKPDVQLTDPNVAGRLAHLLQQQ